VTYSSGGKCAFGLSPLLFSRRTRTHTQTHKHTINCENDLTMVRDTTARSIPSHPTHSSYTNKFTTLVDSHGCRTRGDHSIKMHHQVIFTCLYIRFPCPKSRCLGYLASSVWPVLYLVYKKSSLVDRRSSSIVADVVPHYARVLSL
jgi:hypothetical protein